MRKEYNKLVRDTADATLRDRTSDPEGNDPILSNLGESDFDQLWLFALDVGEG